MSSLQPVSGERQKTAAFYVQDRLAVLVDCFARMYDVMAQDEKAVRRWLNRPNRGLDGMRPLALLEEARLSDLKAVVSQTETASFA
ncbi:MAG TPA: MbcA/ParS/Xre antitoxin family protein [Candidatus Acidoferrales bacterium]|nr:MbcA/ParS/Xre antitoxin family protein [Candidatus Acidoferrales bacterium]